MSDINMIQDIMDVIQKTYGDSSQTILDKECARNILSLFKESGWVSHDDVGMIVTAAGGKVTVPPILRGAYYEVVGWDDVATDALVIKARRINGH